MPATGVLLVNLGTPDAPDTASVRRYLAEFLMDPCVLDMPAPARWLLVHGIILRTRPAKSAEKYRLIWGPEGSPLLQHTRELARRVADGLGSGHRVEVAMRYGQPSIAAGLAALRAAGVGELVTLPLYPQESLATTGSTRREIERAAGALEWSVPLRQVAPFHDDPGFLEASAQALRDAGADSAREHLLFSFHGLPRYQVKKADPNGVCFATADCCAVFDARNAHCYRAQCVRTASAIAERLGWPAEAWSFAFQSRIGAGWIGPHTDHVIAELARKGVKRVVVACPAFVADCLETLEEIGIRGAEQFQNAGGETLRLAPALNASEAWARAVVALVRAARAS